MRGKLKPHVNMRFQPISKGSELASNGLDGADDSDDREDQDHQKSEGVLVVEVVHVTP